MLHIFIDCNKIISLHFGVCMTVKTLFSAENFKLITGFNEFILSKYEIIFQIIRSTVIIKTIIINNLLCVITNELDPFYYLIKLN